MIINEAKWITLLLAGVLTVHTNSAPAQDSNSPMMAGLESPFSQPVFQTLAAEGYQMNYASQNSGQVRLQSHEVYSELSSTPLPRECTNCGQGCTDNHVCADSCVEEKPWWKRKAHKLNRKCYFNYHSYHPKALHPIVDPACQPGYGYYETCWRKISPNPCFCQPDHVPTDTSDLGPANGLHYPQSPEGEPLPPAPAYDR